MNDSIEVRRQVRLRVSPQQAWQLVSDFCPAKHWSSDVLKCELLSGANNEIGAVRLLTLSNGGTAREQLIARQIVEHIYDIGLNNLLQMTGG